MPQNRQEAPLASLRKKLFQKACNGDIPSIQRFCAISRDRLVESDAIDIGRIFTLQVSREVDFNRQSKSPVDARGEELSLASLTALRAINSLLLNPPHPTALPPVLIGLINNRQVWEYYWEWTHRTLDRCVLAPRQHADTIRMIDELFSVLVIRFGKVVLNSYNQKDILPVFSRVVLTDVERDSATKIISALLFPGHFSVNDLTAAIGGCTGDHAEIFMDLLRMAYRHFLDRRQDSYYELFIMIQLLHQAASHVENFTRYLMDLGIVPLFLNIMNDLMTEARRCLRLKQPLSCPQTVHILSVLAIYLGFSVESGPLIIIEALDSGLFPIILSTHALWDYMDAGSVDAEFLEHFGRSARICIDTVTLHLFHRRVFRHYRKAIGRNRGDIPTDLSSKCPFRDSWRILRHRAALAEECRTIHKARGLPKTLPCNNEKCPRLHDKRIRLKECSRCISQKVCSKACQAATWPHHKIVCAEVMEFQKDRTSRPTIMLPPDVLQYYECVVQYFVAHLRTEIHSVHMAHRSKLHRISMRLPTHFLRLDIDQDPMNVILEPLAEYRSMGMNYNLEFVHEEVMREDVKNVIFCIRFHLGTKYIDVFTIETPVPA